jgi:cell division septum initiation protein DivIVA
MSVELHADQGVALPLSAPGTAPEPDRARPNLCGDLPAVLHGGPMFRRTVAGYDRFQVDTYVQWAEEELAAADREREHLLARHLDTRAALEEARKLLSHSPSGGQFLRVSPRIGSMLAAAADDAETIRAEAENLRFVARAQAELMTSQADRVLTDAQAQAERMVAEAATEVEEMTAAAGRLVAEAERTGLDARAEAEARLADVRAIEQRAAEHVEQLRRQAVEETLAARQQARAEIVRMLDTGREERRRADAEAAAIRERLDRDAAARRASLLVEVQDLEHRRAALRAEPDRATGPAAATTGGWRDVHLRRLLVRVRSHPRSLRAS